MNILIYQGTFQYGVVDLFVKNIIDILAQKDHTVFSLNLTDTDCNEQIIQIFTTKVIDCVIAFNGIGAEIKLNNNQSIYDFVNTTFMGIYVDHPVHLLPRIIEPIKNHIVSFIDKEHVSYINELLPQNHKISFFLPHGGFQNNNPIKNFDDYKKLKEINILFAGTYMGDIKKEWDIDPLLPKKILDNIAEELIYDDYAVIHKTFYKYFKQAGIKFSSIGQAQLSELITQMITYVRQFKRRTLIEHIVKSGLKITICGKNWDHFASLHTNIDYKGSLSIEETNELIRRSKILINTTANFTNGSHERVFTGMFNHTVLFSDRSKYYDEYFQENETILYYSFHNLNQDIEKLQHILDNDVKLFEISQEAYKISKNQHSWDNRVETILEMIALSKFMDK